MCVYEFQLQPDCKVNETFFLTEKYLSIACGVTLRLSTNIAVVMAGASRSITSLVASGVMSLGVKPVPP